MASISWKHCNRTEKYTICVAQVCITATGMLHTPTYMCTMCSTLEQIQILIQIQSYYNVDWLDGSRIYPCLFCSADYTLQTYRCVTQIEFTTNRSKFHDITCFLQLVIHQIHCTGGMYTCVCMYEISCLCYMLDQVLMSRSWYATTQTTVSFLCKYTYLYVQLISSLT